MSLQLKKKLLIRRVLLCLLSLASVAAFIVYRQKVLSLLCYCLIKLYIGGLSNEGQITLKKFRAELSSENKLQITTDALWQSDEGSNLIAIKNLSLEFNLPQIYYTRKLLFALYIEGLELNLDGARNDSGSSMVGTFKTKKLLSKFFGSSFIIPEFIDIKNAHIKQADNTYDLKVATRADGVFTVTEITLSDKTINSKIVFSYGQTAKHYKWNCMIDSFPVALLSNIGAFKNADTPTAKHAITGEFSVKSAASADIQGKFYYHGLADTIDERRSHLSVTANAKSGRIVLDKVTLKIPDQHETISVKGAINLYDDKNEAELGISIAADKVSAESIRMLASIGTPTMSKKWCKRSLKSGALINLNASLYMKDIFSPDVSKVKFQAQSKFHGLGLKYSERLPQIDELKGDITVDDRFITFAISGGKMIDTKLGKSLVQIDLLEQYLPLIINTDAVGPIKDFVHFIQPSSYKRLEERKIKLNEASGKTNAHITMRIPLLKEVILSNMDLNVQANLRQFKLVSFGVVKLDGDLKLEIAQNLLSLSGWPLLNGEPVDFRWETYLNGNQAFDNRLTINAEFGKPGGLLSLFADKVIVSDGLMPTKILYVGKGLSEQISMHATLDNIRLSIPYLGLFKENSKRASFDMVIEKDAENWQTKRCEFISPEEESKIDIDAEFNAGLGLLTHLAATVKSKYNNLKFSLNFTESEYKLYIKGSSIVSSGDQLSKFISSQDFSPNVKLSVFINLDKVLLKHGVAIHRISGRLSCYKDRCTNDALLMRIKDNDKPSADMKIYSKDGAFIIQTSDAAALLKGLGLYNELDGGSMRVKLYPMQESSANASRYMEGELQISNFKAIKTPIIGKLILLTPFAQIVEQLKGATMLHFKTLDAHFTIKDKFVQINRSIADGSLLAVTINGHIDMEQKRISLYGKLIPNSLLNAFLSGIQDKNRQFPEKYKIGTDYKIYGDLANPKIVVSPIGVIISLLTKPLSII